MDKISKLELLFISPLIKKSKANLVVMINNAAVVTIKIRKSLFLKLIKKENTEAIKGRNNNRYGKMEEDIYCICEFWCDKSTNTRGYIDCIAKNN